MKTQRSEFADLVEQYDAARPAYPAKVIQEVLSSIGKEHPSILDLGCGTGISTRQLAKRGATVVGCDLDLRMLTSAISHAQKNVTYAQGSASALPFGSEMFDAVTAFTSFHWFTDKKSVSEIKRVLKPSGVFCIVHPRNTSAHGRDLRNIIEQTIQRKTVNNYSDTAFVEALTRAGFICAQLPIVKQTIRYPLETFLLLLQSYSVWNNVPETMQPEMRRILKKHFSKQLKNGAIIQTRNLEIVVAKKGR